MEVNYLEVLLLKKKEEYQFRIGDSEIKNLAVDVLTIFPYIGIIILVGINAALVYRRDIRVDDSEHNPGH